MKVLSVFIILLVLISNSHGQEGVPFDEDLKYAQVTFARLTEQTNGKWSIDVTLEHNDSGWEHYADLWEIVETQSEVIIGSRELLHPHVAEQPFTRGLSGMIIRENTRFLYIRAKCNLHGFQGKRIYIDLEKEKTSEYEIHYRN